MSTRTWLPRFGAAFAFGLLTLGVPAWIVIASAAPAGPTGSVPQSLATTGLYSDFEARRVAADERHVQIEHARHLDDLYDAEEWQRLRVIRNRFAHDYPEDDALKAAYLNEAAEAVDLLANALGRFATLALQHRQA